MTLQKQLLLVLFAVVIIWIVVAFMHMARAHEAPSGFKYPSECCGGHDCRPVPCASIRERADGAAYWTGLFFTREQVRMSGDGSCHVCVSYDMSNPPTRYPHCIFLAPTM